MKIHEYQAKVIFAKYGVPIPKGYPAFTVDEAEAAANKLVAETKSPVVVVKAQIHAGGRGKGGGVKVAKGGAAEARQLTEKILGMQLITHQTGPEGQKVRRVYIEQGLAMVKEFYLGAVVDRDQRRVAFMVVDQKAAWRSKRSPPKRPEKIMTVHVDPTVGLAAYQARRARVLPRPRAVRKRDGREIREARSPRSTRLFIKEDCSLCEINPLVVLKNGDVVALDGEIELRRQRGVSATRNWDALRDTDEEDPAELEAKANRPQLRFTRRQRRLSRQRRRFGDGDDGHHQALRR